MPELCRFFGIVISMFWKEDHHPVAHFHAYYGEFSASIAIDTLQVLDGNLPRRALAMVLEWAELHRDELREDWARARAQEPLAPIAPLE